MALIDYAIAHQENGYVDDGGTKEWVVVYKIPQNHIDSELPNLEASVDNKYPGSNTSNIYSPCIHRAFIGEFPGQSGFKKATVWYRKPTLEVILQPGRGILFSELASTSGKVLKIFKAGASDPATGDELMVMPVFKKGRETQLFPQGEFGVMCADEAEDELEIFDKLMGWVGKRNDRDHDRMPKGKKNNLMFLGAKTRRRPSDISVLDIRAHFLIDEDGKWEWEVQHEKRQLDFSTIQIGEWMSVGRAEKGMVARGDQDFSYFDDMLSWLG